MTYWILTEGGGPRGLGHITRCHTLYQGLVDRGEDVKMLINTNYHDVYLVLGKVFPKWNSKTLPKISSKDTVIVDSYFAPYKIYEEISEKASKGVWLDDFRRMPYPPGVILNGNVYGQEIKYVGTYCTCLTGPKYFLLRPQFKRRKTNINPHIRKVVVSETVTEKIPFKKLAKYDEVICPPRIEAAEMADLMFEADLFITAAGQTLAELAYVGTPTVSIVVVDNQISNFEYWSKTGFIEPWSKSCLKTLKSPKERERRRKIGQAQIDGLGLKRVLEYI
jgi:spore coat polysaccharide biosynthesis predicted glycosyltransferase SpsG